jgi:uncharacterized protein (TIGR00290 family)
MTGRPPSAVVSWSGGKDSMLALHRVMSSREYKAEALITTVTDGYDRISMHGVRTSLLEEQAASLGIPLEIARIPQKANNEQYEASMLEALAPFAARGIKDVICGDLYLADIREYREKLFARIGMHGVYPLWLEDTRKLAEEFITLGYRASICCVDPKAVPDTLSGREFDDTLLADLPEGCDPCGENGEFHSFVYDGPLFKSPVKLSLGECVTRDGFCFTDLIPAQ